MSMVQVESYTFGTIENPLSDSGNFTTIADANFTGVLKAITGNLCEPTTVGPAACASFFSGSVPAPGNTWPADQYTEITLTTWATIGDFAYLVCRQGSAASGNQYLCSLSENGTYGFIAVVGGVTHSLQSGAQVSSQGDVFRMSVAGNVLTLFRNGGQVQTVTDTNNYLTSGSPGFGLLSASAIANAQTNAWAAGANQAATPTFTPNGGSFNNHVSVAISSSTLGGTIYYTTDGSTPTHSSSSIANGGFVTINATATLKAIASVANFVDSAVASASFTIILVAPAVTVSGIIKDISGNPIAGTVTATLANFGLNPPLIPGNSELAPIEVSATAAADGTWSLTLWGQDQISPINTIYTIRITPAGSNVASWIAEYIIKTGAYDLSNLTPLNKYPALAVPSGGQTGPSGPPGPAGPAGGSLPMFGSYTFYISSGTCNAQNDLTGAIDFSNADAAVVIRSVINNLPNGGKLFFKNGIYNLNSLLLENTGGFTNYYAIGIPGGGPTIYACWSFEGESFTPVIDQFGITAVQTNGVILNLTTTAENSVAGGSVIFAVWARPDTVNGAGATVSMKNITVRLPSNQRGSETAINLTQALMSNYEFVVADFNIAWGSLAFPVAGSGGLYGITTTASNKEENYMKNTYAAGYDVCLDVQTEHAILENSYGLDGNHAIDYGVRGNPIYHGSSWISCGWGECARGLTLGTHCLAGSLLDIATLDIEDATASIFPAFQPVYHAKETTAGNSFGRISYSVVTAGVGIGALAALFDGGGGANFTTVNPNCTVLQPRISKPAAFSTLPAAAAGNEGCLAFVTDSTTAVWGATITGGGANHVLAYSDGTNWTVAGK